MTTNIHRDADIRAAQTLHVTADNAEWFRALGESAGEGQVLDTMHPDAQSLIENFRPDEATALRLPWPDMSELVRFPPGMWTVWSGPTFAGKTTLLRQLMLHAMLGDHRRLKRAFVISLEEKPQAVWRENITMLTATRTPTPEQISYALELLHEKLYVFNSTLMIEPMVLLGVIRYAAEKFGIEHVVLDSLMRLNIAKNDWDGQRQLGNQIGRTAELASVHMHVVAHPRKTENSRKEMDLYDIGGAQDIVAQADLIATIERHHEDSGIVDPDKPDAMLKFWKQRGDVDWVGFVKLYRDAASRQFLYRRNDAPARYLP